jgi:hypothetical protein
MQTLRSRRLNIRLSEQEWQKAHRLMANTTCRSISEYARKLLTNQPVSQIFRNPSLEEFMTRIPPLTDYIEGIGRASRWDYEFRQTYGNAIELAEDIRTYLAKLSEL